MAKPKYTWHKFIEHHKLLLTMSENLLKIIPEQPVYIPESEAQIVASGFLKSLVAENCEVQFQVSNEIEFVDAGGNFENVSCSTCGKEISGEWWSTAMNKVHQSHFSQLDIVVPCCNSKTTLNQLNYNWAQGFAKFVLTARNPNISELDKQSVIELEKILGCKLRLIWAHY